jgi:DNA repair protein RadC
MAGLMLARAMRELPEEDRPRERLERLGPEALRDAELLAILFRTGTRELGAVAFAERVLAHFGDLRTLARASLGELCQVKGVGRAKATEIQAALELGRRLAVFSQGRRVAIRSSSDVADLLMVRYKEIEVETFKAVLLTTKNEVRRVVDVATGGLDVTLALPRDVFRQAVREAASAVIVCHNHPSGDPEPSSDDLRLTTRLSESAQLLGIRLLDHVIFGDGRYVSLKDRGVM